MLTTPDNLLFFHLLDHELQDKLLHHLSQDGGEADRPVVPWVLLLALFEDWSNIDLSPVLGHLSCPPGPFKDWWRVTQQWHPPAPSALVGAFHRGPWICGCPDRLSDPSHSPPQPRESRPLCRLLLLPPWPGIPEGQS